MTEFSLDQLVSRWRRDIQTLIKIAEENPKEIELAWRHFKDSERTDSRAFAMAGLLECALREAKQLRGIPPEARDPSTDPL